MMQERFPNGCSVTRLWSDNKTELLAAFQYKADAEQFVQVKLKEDVGCEWKASYIIANTYNGAVDVIGPQKPDMGTDAKV